MAKVRAFERQAKSNSANLTPGRPWTSPSDWAATRQEGEDLAVSIPSQALQLLPVLGQRLPVSGDGLIKNALVFRLRQLREVAAASGVRPELRHLIVHD